MSYFNADRISLIDRETTVFWFRRDLRLRDNTGLYHALKNEKKVLPIFIFDSVILNKLEDKNDPRIEFIHESLHELQKELVQLGSSLLVLHGNPVELIGQMEPLAVYTNHDYERYANDRDKKVDQILKEKGIPFKTYKDHVIFEKNEVIKTDGEPYTVFTPYSRQWKVRLEKFYYRSFPVAKYFGSLKKTDPAPLPSLQELGFEKSTIQFPKRMIRKSLISTYNETRDIPAIHGTSRLGVHLRFGTVSIRQLVQIAVDTNETWLNELIWREFFSVILFHFPHVETKSFKPAYDKIPWRNNETEFQAWCEGRTGYPLVDAGMRELNATGFMHNRVRMVTASFLVKHLLIDWRWGEAYFARRLLDYDLASNNGGWQWAAGCGCDAAPYFRVFNPTLQMEKFDPQKEYVRRWVGEFGTRDYPSAIVEHTFARQRAIRTYQKSVRS